MDVVHEINDVAFVAAEHPELGIGYDLWVGGGLSTAPRLAERLGVFVAPERTAAIAGCAIVYTVQIGGPAAAKLVARRIHPMKTATELPIAELVAKLQEVLRGTPPPWLRKAMGGGAGLETERVGE